MCASCASWPLPGLSRAKETLHAELLVECNEHMICTIGEEINANESLPEAGHDCRFGLLRFLPHAERGAGVCWTLIEKETEEC